MNQKTKSAEADSGAASAKRTSPAKNQEARGTGKSARKTKSATVIALLSRPRGATLDEMMKATGWQSHSVRGFLAGTVKKKLGNSITFEAGDKGRAYRIAAEAK